MATPGHRAAKGQLLTVRDLRNLRAKVLNSIALHEQVSGPLDIEMAEVDAIGRDEGDTTSLLTRTLGLLYEITKAPNLRPTMRMRAGRVIADTIGKLKAEQLRARVEEARIQQRSAETQVQAAVKLAEIEVEERRLEAEHDPAQGLSLDDLKRMQAEAKRGSP